jgi:hypothetical protein
MRIVLRIASSLHRLLFRYAAVMAMALLVGVTDFVVSRWLGYWGAHGQLMFMYIGLSLLLMTPVWHFVTGFLIARFHRPSIDLIVAAVIGLLVSLLHIGSMAKTLSEAHGDAQWLLFVSLSTFLFMASWVLTEFLYRHLVHRYSKAFKHWLDEVPPL